MLLSLAAFTVAATLVVLLPGPDTLVVLRNLVRGGRAAAVRAVAGVLTGLVVWVSAAALGLSALLRASHDGYLALRVAGAVYLVWMGVQSLRSRGETSEDTPASRASLLGSGFRAGLLTDLLNPKVGVFFVTFLPGFVPHGYPIGMTTLLLGLLFALLTALYFAILLAVSSSVTRWMTTRRIRKRMDRATGMVLVGFGIRLVVEH